MVTVIFIKLKPSSEKMPTKMRTMLSSDLLLSKKRYVRMNGAFIDDNISYEGTFDEFYFKNPPFA